MKKLLLASVAMLALTPLAFAADNSELPTCDGITTGGCAVKRPFANKDIGGVHFPKTILHDESGNAINLGNPLPVTAPGAADGDAPSTFGPVGARMGTGTTGGKDYSLVQCNQSFVVDVTTSGSVQIKALAAGQAIYVCSYWFKAGTVAGTEVKVKLTYGTGTNCATGKTSMTPYMRLTDYDGAIDTGQLGTNRAMATAVANALCFETDAGEPVTGLVKLTQF